MDCGILLERDILYPTDIKNEPGSIHLQVLSPDKNSKVPVVIEPKSEHSPLKYIDAIIRIIQSDIFDRVFIDIKKDVDIYVRATADTAGEFAGYTHMKVYFSGGRFINEGVNW